MNFIMKLIQVVTEKQLGNHIVPDFGLWHRNGAMEDLFRFALTESFIELKVRVRKPR